MNDVVAKKKKHGRKTSPSSSQFNRKTQVFWDCDVCLSPKRHLAMMWRHKARLYSINKAVVVQISIVLIVLYNNQLCGITPMFCVFLETNKHQNLNQVPCMEIIRAWCMLCWWNSTLVRGENNNVWGIPSTSKCDKTENRHCCWKEAYISSCVPNRCAAVHCICMWVCALKELSCTRTH